MVNFCEFDKFASKSYCAIHDVDESLNLGDITKVDEHSLNPFNMICGGSPCFVAGTKIQTKDGYKNIEEIYPGDYVLTHKNRYMRVNRVGGESCKEIFRLKAQGVLDIFATSYHPFYVRRTKDDAPQKIHLSDIQRGNYIGCHINTSNENLYNLSNEECWILGRYVADGHVRKYKRKDRKNSYQYQLVLSVGIDKVDDVKQQITEYHYSCYPHSQSVYRVVISSMKLVNFIIEHNFGRNALEKRIPQFILNLPIDKLKSFLDGYMSGDGCHIENANLFKATTVSKELALGLMDAVQKTYRVGVRMYCSNRPDKYVIEGRTVNQHDTYQLVFSIDSNRKHDWMLDGDIIWYPVKKVESTGRVEDVYNIEVEEDHTYTANNVIVYNCQDFSVAGKQKGSMWSCPDCGQEWNPLTVHYTERHKCPNCGSTNIDKTRSSLLVEWLRIIRANKPKWGIYENVKNITGKKFAETFQMFLDELHEYGYNTYYKVLNAKDYGVPQNRERVYLIIILKEFDNGLFEFPEGFDNGIRLKDVLEDEVDEKYYVNTPKAKELIDELISSGKLDKEISNTVRTGGRSSFDKHQWDLVKT